jgi:CCR4-NOT transcription complex subunit 9
MMPAHMPVSSIRAREALRSCLPELLRNAQFTACLKNDDTTRR